MNLEEKTIQTKEIFDGKIIKVQVEDVTLPNGHTSKREIIKHPGAVAVIPITKDNKIIFVKQYRKPLEKVLVEIPAGKLEEGEAPITTALRELEEETGYTTKSLHYVTSFYTSPGFADEIIYLYETSDLEKLEVEKQLDEDEFVELLELTLEEAEHLIQSQEIHDAKTAYAILYLKSKGMR
ncbi:NUDIX domain-containing protein [Gracilibacillus dipsosauri]|uniref:NUDIX domain-containing protein n=1 Tax=Gracilibacillus dipsosauri TaxID=178340 RepID=UPI001FE4DEA0|nr:NUDIX hydrolase [Gracilibacillus dipsosauri]